MVSELAERRRGQLREFLRDRRARVAPEQVGLPVAGRRRTPGLRREEVALLAGVGVSWYTWLEQGRDITVSADVLDAIARALQLSRAEQSYLYLLAGLNPPPAGASSGGEVTAEIRRLLDAWSPLPVVLRDRYWNVLAYNDIARLMFGFDGTAQNCLVTFFTNPRYLAVREPWESAAPAVAAAYRADAAHAPGDPGFERVVTELSALSPEFAALWERHDVGEPEQAVNVLHHPEAGELYFDATTLILAHRPDWNLVLYNPRPDTPTLDRLAQLDTSLVAPHLR
ncbi:helix-turn-helix transcriptional regulator [Nocardia sp. NPDC020380]|uniref:helix-turn-helix transcriptional regulator n=1 Tax=Nocardia sp. NPDC020380 TaxID=3364309 RepID=UPI003792E8DC